MANSDKPVGTFYKPGHAIAKAIIEHENGSDILKPDLWGI